MRESSPVAIPYWRLSGFYFVYFATIGALIPYWSIYLKDLGFNAAEIGELVAIIMATKLVAPNLWGWIADHTRQGMRIIRLTSLLAAISFVGVFFTESYLWLAVVMVVFSFFWNAALPQFEVTTMNHLGESTHRYSSIRLWGSIGFVVTVAMIGPMLDMFGVRLLLPVSLGLFVLIWVFSLLVPEGQQPQSHTGNNERFHWVLRKPEVLALLLICFLMQMSHGPYYTFFSIYMEEHGYSHTAIGQLWALGVVAEVIVFMVMHRWMPRFGARYLMIVSLLLTTLRWLLTAFFPDYVAVIIFSQTLHAASFGIYHAVAIDLIHKMFVGRLQGRGQALYSSVSFGAGGAIGSLLSGYLWSGVGAQWMYVLAALTSGIAVMVAMWGLRDS